MALSSRLWWLSLGCSSRCETDSLVWCSWEKRAQIISNRCDARTRLDISRNSQIQNSTLDHLGPPWTTWPHKNYEEAIKVRLKVMRLKVEHRSKSNTFCIVWFLHLLDKLRNEYAGDLIASRLIKTHQDWSRVIRSSYSDHPILCFQDGLTGSAWGDWSLYTDSPLRWMPDTDPSQCPKHCLAEWPVLWLAKQDKLDSFWDPARSDRNLATRRDYSRYSRDLKRRESAR